MARDYAKKHLARAKYGTQVASNFRMREDIWNMKNYLKITFIACITNLCKSHEGIRRLLCVSTEMER